MSTVLRFRCSDEFAILIKARARKHRMTASTYLRKLAAAEMKRPAPPGAPRHRDPHPNRDVLIALRMEVRAMGKNTNDMAKKFHQTAQLAYAKRAIDEMQKAVSRINKELSK